MQYSGTVLQRGRIPVNVREALAGGACSAGREFMCLRLLWGGNVAVVLGGMRSHSKNANVKFITVTLRLRCQGGGHSTGQQKAWLAKNVLCGINIVFFCKPCFLLGQVTLQPSSLCDHCLCYSNAVSSGRDLLKLYNRQERFRQFKSFKAL